MKDNYLTGSASEKKLKDFSKKIVGGGQKKLIFSSSSHTLPK